MNRGWLGATAALACIASAAASSQAQPTFATVDSIAVRYFAPETGGAARPRFISSRQVDFEARLLALEEDPQGSIHPRHVRAAIESHVADDVLASLPLDPEPDPATVARISELVRAALEQRAAGKAAFDQAAKQDGMSATEVDALVRRQARAAIYLDRSTPLLAYTEDQLREAYRTTGHPFRQRRFDECRDELVRWLVIERFRDAEQAYLQTARSRLTVVYPGSG